MRSLDIKLITQIKWLIICSLTFQFKGFHKSEELVYKQNTYIRKHKNSNTNIHNTQKKQTKQSTPL